MDYLCSSLLTPIILIWTFLNCCHGACTDLYENCSTWAQQGQCSSNHASMLAYCSKSCNFCSCIDENQMCSSWAQAGECQRNPIYMKNTCRKSCELCDKEEACKDDNDNCHSWAHSGECHTNPSYMHVSCRLSCGICRISHHQTPEVYTTTAATPAGLLTYKNCSIYSTFASVAHATNILDRSTLCSQGNVSPSIATVQQLCNAPSNTNNWKQGYKVLEHCDEIPRFSPVATFNNGLITSDVMAGILIDCNASSLVVVTQTCENPTPAAYIIHGNSQSPTSHNPGLFYSIMWT